MGAILRTLLALGVGAMLFSSCSGKVIVTKVPNSENSRDKLDLDGVLYTLPRTVIKVTVPVERTQFKRAVYADYRELFFPEPFKDEDPGKKEEEPKVKYTVGKPVFSTFGEPDLSKLYYVKLTGWGPVDRTASLDYTEQGTVSGVQAGADNYTTDLVLSVLSAAAGVATRVAFGGGPAVLQGAPDTCAPEVTGDDKVQKVFHDAGAEEVFATYCDLRDSKLKNRIRSEVVAVGGNAKANIPLLRATKAYKELRDLKKARQELIVGKVAFPLPSLELMLKEIDTVTATQLANAFTGQTKKDTWTPTFEVRPTVLAQPVDLFKFDEANGVCLLVALPTQETPPKEFGLDGECKSLDIKIARVAFALNGEDQVFKRTLTAFKQDGERSFRYLIPASTLATLEIGQKKGGAGTGAEFRKSGTALIMVGQFGAEVSLPASSGGRSLNYNLKFFEATGAMKSFSLASKSAMQAANVNSVSSATNAVLDAKNKQDQAALNAADELNRLERQRKILEDRAKIRELCAQLKISCSQ